MISRPTNRKALHVGALALTCALAMLVFAAALPAAGQAAPTRKADVTVASSGNCLLSVDGTFKTAGKTAVLNRINAIRKEACEQGVPNPDNNGVALTSSDYTPMRWSKDLETIAQTRAAESSLFQEHTRPNGTLCFTAHQGLAVNTYAENLAWNYSGMLEGIEQWYGEKADWVAQNANAVTGHYESLISPSHVLVGLGTFAPSQGGWAATAGEFSFDPSSYDSGIVVDQGETGVKGAYRQVIEVPTANVAGLVVEGNGSFTAAGSRTFATHLNVNAPSAWGTNATVKMNPTSAVSWKSSATKVATVSAGKVTVKHSGSAKITASAMGKSGSMTVTAKPKKTKVKKLAAKKKSLKVTWAKNTSLTSGYQIRYSTKKSMSGAKTVTVKGAGKKSKTIKKLKAKKRYYVQVRAYEKVGGKTFTSAWSSKKSKKTK